MEILAFQLRWFSREGTLPTLHLCRLEFHKKRYAFRGMHSYAGFRSGQEYELEPGLSPADDERPAELVIINPVSRQYMYCSKQELATRWAKREEAETWVLRQLRTSCSESKSVALEVLLMSILAIQRKRTPPWQPRCAVLCQAQL